MSGIAGGDAPVSLEWQGLGVRAGTTAPLLLLGVAGASLLGICWLVTGWARSGVGVRGTLLPGGLDHLGRAGKPDGPAASLRSNPPAAVWWLSLVWLEAGVWGFGALLGRSGMMAGGLLGRLEGRFYLPLALILTLIALLAVTR